MDNVLSLMVPLDYTAIRAAKHHKRRLCIICTNMKCYVKSGGNEELEDCILVSQKVSVCENLLSL